MHLENNQIKIYIISKRTDEVNDWQLRNLDLSLVTPDMLIDEVRQLIFDVKLEQQSLFQTMSNSSRQPSENGQIYNNISNMNSINLSNMNSNNSYHNLSNNNNPDSMLSYIDQNQTGHTTNTNNNTTNYMLVSFTEFRKLVLRCLKKRDGNNSKSYIFAPKKRPIIALEMIQKEKNQETFHPKINSISETLNEIRKKRLEQNVNSSIHDAPQINISKNNITTNNNTDMSSSKLEKGMCVVFVCCLPYYYYI